MRILPSLVVGLLILGACGRAEAQVTRADSAAVLLHAATTFAREGRPEVAAALHQLILERFAGTPAADRARIALARPVPEPRGGGATELRIWGTLYGGWLGVAVPGAFGVDDSRGYGAGLLVGAPLGFLASRAWSRRVDPTMGEARAITFGGSWGTWQGFGWRKVLGLGDDESGDTLQETFAAMVIGGATGIAAGALLGRSVSDAVATGANMGALWGSGIVAAVGHLVDVEGDDLLAATLVGGNVGLFGAAFATPTLGFSRDQWRVVSVGGVVGGLAGLGLDLLIRPDNEKVAVAIPLATSLAGLAIGGVVHRPSSAAEAEAPPTSSGLGGFVEIDRGAVRMGVPAVVPRTLPVETPAGVRWQPTWGIHWLRVALP